MAQEIKAIVLGRADTLDKWTEHDPIPRKGELIVVTDTGRIKIGDGAKHFSELPVVGTDGKSLEFVIEGDLLKIRKEGTTTWSEIIAKGPPGNTPVLSIDEHTGNWLVDGKDTEKPSRGVKGDKGEATVLTISEDGYAELDGVKTSTLMRANPTELLTYVNGKAVLWNVGIVNGEPVLNWRDKV